MTNGRTEGGRDRGWWNRESWLDFSSTANILFVVRAFRSLFVGQVPGMCLSNCAAIGKLIISCGRRSVGRSVGEKKEEEEEVEVEWWWQDIIKCAQCNWEEVPLTFAILLWRKLNSTFIASKLLCCCSCTVCGSIQYRYMYIVSYPEPEGFFPNSSVSCCSLGFVVFSPDLPFPFAAIRCATQKVWEKTRNSISINVVADLFLSTRGAVLVNFFSRWEYGQVRRRRRSLFAGESIKFIYCGRWRSLLSNILNTKHEEEASRLNTVLGFCPTAPTRLL